MRNLIWIVVGLFVMSCQQKEEKKGYYITGTIQGFDDGTMVYVNTLNESNRPVAIDSAKIKNNTFTLDPEEVEKEDLHFLTFKNTGGNVVYIGENYPIEMRIHRDSLRDPKIEGGPDNKLFFEYINTMKGYGEQRKGIGAEFMKASKEKNQDRLNALSKTQQQLKETEKTYREDLVRSNPNSVVSVMALSDMFSVKSNSTKEIKELYAAIDPRLKETRFGKNLTGSLEQASTAADIGIIAEDFSAPTPEGKELSLKDAMGKVTIVDFWASWCKPCRIENPNVVRIYNKYHDQGLNIIGISLDKTEQKWKDAIQQDNLTWNHVSNLQFWQEPIARAYGVRAIPATFILNEEGMIVAKNLRGQDLEMKVKELLEAAKGQEDPAS